MADASKDTVLNPQEQRARELLAQGLFRKARDEFKVLCKTDRTRYLPWLIEANCGLARAMVGKGMKLEAMQVLSYLKTLGPSVVVQALEIELGADGGQTQGGLAGLLSLMADPNLPATTRQRLADQAVLRFELPAEETRAASAGELGAIIKALRAISERQYQLALDLVRPLPHVSPFSHWKTLVKGLAAFHGGEGEKAVRAFDTLPAASAPGKIAQPYRWLAETATADPISHSAVPSEKTIEMACCLAGAPPGCGAILSRAEQAWRSGRPEGMYQALRSIPAFPRQGGDFIGTLSDFAVGCLRILSPDQRGRYICELERIAHSGVSKSEMETAMLIRSAIMTMGYRWEDRVLIGEWSEFVKLCDRLHGPNPKRSSLAYGWLGEFLAKPEDEPYWPGDRPFLRNTPEARRALETSLSFDEGNLGASLLLCKVYETLKLHADRNRLLDKLTARFPGEKAVLVLAGQGCLERKACAKALNYFEQALAMDRLDPNIPDWLVETHTTQSLQYFLNRKLDHARKAMDQALALALDQPAGAKRARWRLQTRLGLMETFFGEAERGATLLQEVRATSPSTAAFLYFASLAGLEMNHKRVDHLPFLKEFNGLSGRQIQARDAILLTEIWTQHKERVRPQDHWQFQNALETTLRKASKSPFSREEAVKLIEFLLVEEGTDVSQSESTALPFVNAWLRKCPDDLLFQLYRVRLGAEPNPENVLKKIIDEATRRKDDQTARMARQQLNAILAPPPPFPMPDPEFDDDFQDDFDETDPFGADMEDLVERLFPNMPANDQALMLGFLAMIANAPPSMLEEMKRTRPPGMSAKEFDLLVKTLHELPAPAAQNKALPKPTVKRAKPGTPPWPDPHQRELF